MLGVFLIQALVGDVTVQQFCLGKGKIGTSIHNSRLIPLFIELQVFNKKKPTERLVFSYLKLQVFNEKRPKLGIFVYFSDN